MGAVSHNRTAVTTPLVWVVVWVAVVAVVATSVWLVISRAGAGVSSSQTRFAPDRPAAAASSTSAPTSGTPTPTSGTPSPSGSPSAPATAAPVRRTASGSRGTITVECAGATARLTGATPRSGAVSQVEDDGAQRVRVDFEDDGGRTRIEASCVDGQPTFDVDDD
jgi:hypothetical protein